MKVKLKKVRLSFPDIFESVEYEKGDGKPRFNATFLIEPGSENDQAITEAIKNAANEKLGAKAVKFLVAIQGNRSKMAYTDGDLVSYDGYEGMWSLAAHSKTKPTVLDKDGTILGADAGRPYAGCYVHALVDIYCQGAPNAGIRAAFTGIKFVADGDAFAGSAPAKAEDFDDLSEGDEENTDTDDMSDLL